MVCVCVCGVCGVVCVCVCVWWCIITYNEKGLKSSMNWMQKRHYIFTAKYTFLYESMTNHLNIFKSSLTTFESKVLHWFKQVGYPIINMFKQKITIKACFTVENFNVKGSRAVSGSYDEGLNLTTHIWRVLHSQSTRELLWSDMIAKETFIYCPHVKVSRLKQIYFFDRSQQISDLSLKVHYSDKHIHYLRCVHLPLSGFWLSIRFFQILTNCG